MKISRLPVVATSFAACMVTMVSFLACVLLWAVTHHPALHILLPHLLPGFPAVTITGLLAGLAGSLVAGNIVGAIFALSFNLWNVLAQRGRPGAAR